LKTKKKQKIGSNLKKGDCHRGEKRGLRARAKSNSDPGALKRKRNVGVNKTKRNKEGGKKKEKKSR